MTMPQGSFATAPDYYSVNNKDSKNSYRALVQCEDNEKLVRFTTLVVNSLSTCCKQTKWSIVLSRSRCLDLGVRAASFQRWSFSVKYSSEWFWKARYYNNSDATHLDGAPGSSSISRSMCCCHGALRDHSPHSCSLPTSRRTCIITCLSIIRRRDVWKRSFLKIEF